jgi:hypothetical protein
MKKVLLASAALAVLASPAFAASHRYTSPRAQSAQEAYARAAYPDAAQFSNQPGAVFSEGRYVGSDPDSFIRLQLDRDAHMSDY